MTIRPQPIRRPRSWRTPIARLARWLTGAHLHRPQHAARRGTHPDYPHPGPHRPYGTRPGRTIL